jgi:NAD(P)-dependent dehydrogenase (short-subunit alcohol dehydrogenase family)
MGEEKIALVTGGNRGIGFGLCRALAEKGYRVILTARNEKSGREKAQELISQGLPVEFLPLDVDDEKSIQSALSSIKDRYGRLDVLVNNAGILLDRNAPPNKTLLTQTLETNVIGPYLLCQAAADLMKAKRQGRIVNVSSHISSLATMQGDFPAYRISKTALNAVTRIFAAQLKPFNILVNSVCPGWVKTDMGGPNAPLPLEKGIASILWAIDLPDDGPTGHFFQHGKSLDW